MGRGAVLCRTFILVGCRHPSELVHHGCLVLQIYRPPLVAWVVGAGGIHRQDKDLRDGRCGLFCTPRPHGCCSINTRYFWATLSLANHLAKKRNKPYPVIEG